MSGCLCCIPTYIVPLRLTRRIHTKIPIIIHRDAPTAPADISALLLSTAEELAVSSMDWICPPLLVGCAEFVPDCKVTAD